MENRHPMANFKIIFAKLMHLEFRTGIAMVLGELGFGESSWSPQLRILESEAQIEAYHAEEDGQVKMM